MSTGFDFSTRMYFSQFYGSKNCQQNECCQWNMGGTVHNCGKLKTSSTFKNIIFNRKFWLNTIHFPHKLQTSVIRPLLSLFPIFCIIYWIAAWLALLITQSIDPDLFSSLLFQRALPLAQEGRREGGEQVVPAPHHLRPRRSHMLGNKKRLRSLPRLCTTGFFKTR